MRAATAADEGGAWALNRVERELGLPVAVPHIFPTTHRDKHAKTVSFPLGAEALSRALDGVPQHGMLTCSFVAGDLKRELSKPLTHVLHVTYRQQARSFHHSEDAALRGVFDPQWSIAVFSVQSSLRHAVKTVLIDHELPSTVWPWLVHNADITGRTGMRALVFEYDQTQGVIVRSERDAILPDRA